MRMSSTIGILRTGNKASAVGREVGYETGHIFWLSDALNWHARKKLKHPFRKLIERF
jgi:hypothetical protein